MRRGGSVRFRRIAALLLFTLFAFYFTSVNLLYHTHVVDGERITHSHPAPGKHHQHSAKNINLIAQLAMYIAVVAAVAAILAFVVFAVRDEQKPLERCYENRAVCRLYLRGPPAKG